MRVFLKNLGCPRNLVDAECMLGRIVEAGHTTTDDPGKADAVIINTCGFTTPAAQESVDAICELAEEKKKKPWLRLIVTGCLVERYRESMASAMPEVDTFLGTGAYHEITTFLSSQPPDKKIMLPPPEAHPLPGPGTPRCVATFPSAYVKIAEGCNHRCTFCIIPGLRGRLRSRPSDSVISEVANLVEQGFREIVLIAQDTYAYGLDLDIQYDIADLLMDASRAAGREAWIRLLYGNPWQVTDRLLSAIKELENVCPYFDIPVQHASEKILKLMGRKGKKEELASLFSLIRERVPGACLRTTVMTGFPGETQKDFENLCEFIEKVKFDHLGVFIYSDAREAPSHRLPDHVDPQEAEYRRKRIMEQQAAISSRLLQEKIGRKFQVIIEAIDQETGYAYGRTHFQAPEIDGITRIVKGNGLALGQIIDVRITGAETYDLIGEPL